MISATKLLFNTKEGILGEKSTGGGA